METHPDFENLERVEPNPINLGGGPNPSGQVIQTKNPLQSGVLPPQMVQAPDQQRSFNERAGGMLPFARILPVGPSGNAAANAAANTAAAKAVSEAASAVTVSLNVPNIFTPIFQKRNGPDVKLSVALSPESDNTVFAADVADHIVGLDTASSSFAIPATGTSAVTISATPSIGAGEWAVWLVSLPTNSVAAMPSGWTGLIGEPDTNFTKNVAFSPVVDTNPVSINQPTNGDTAWSSAIAIFDSAATRVQSISTSVSAVTSSGTKTVTLAAPVTTGNSVMIFILASQTCTAPDSPGLAPSFDLSDSLSSSYQEVVNSFTSGGYNGSTTRQGSALHFLIAQNVTGGSDTVTVDYTIAGPDTSLTFTIYALEMTPFTVNLNIPHFQLLKSGHIPPINLDQIDVRGGVTGNLGVDSLNSGLGASSNTAWFGDGTWKTVASSGTLFYQTVQSESVSATQRAKLNFGSGFTVTDNPGNDSTDIEIANASGFNQSILVDGVAMSDDYWVSVDEGAYDQWLPALVA